MNVNCNEQKYGKSNFKRGKKKNCIIKRRYHVYEKYPQSFAHYKLVKN